MATIDVKALSDEDLRATYTACLSELDRRQTVATAIEQVSTINTAVLAADGIDLGQPYRQPTGAHDAYPKGWTVTSGGKTWESLIDGNVWEPGTSGWREVVEPGAGAAAWVQPTGAHDAYSKGARVAHAGSTWTSDVDDNVWEPGAYGWTKTL